MLEAKEVPRRVHYVRRLRPGIGLDSARALIAGYVADPTRLEDFSGRITAFRLSSCFGRLERCGRLEGVLIGDPFHPRGVVRVEMTEAESGRQPASAIALSMETDG